MALTKTQQTIWEKSRAIGAGEQGVGLDDDACAYLVARIALDLDLGARFPEVRTALPGFFDGQSADMLVLPGVDARALFERLLDADRDADMYYACLATLHKARLKYQAILETQPIPTLEQVGPRGLLQYGRLSPAALVGFLFWRKWFFDIDNRAGQETGYLFEPVIANAVGGTPIPAKKSPVKRHRDKGKGRQVDCLLGKRAYEIKIRLTIAASGQGRWREELDYPIDCRKSGYAPVLIVLDGTPNPKLVELEAAFQKAGGEVYVGDDAWRHLESLAGPTMSRFLEKYVRQPIKRLIEESPSDLPDMIARMEPNEIIITVGGEALRIRRRTSASDYSEGSEIPDDLPEDIAG